MKVTVIGTKDVCFTSKEGTTITGMTIYYATDAVGVNGMQTNKVFVPAAKVPTKAVTVGSDVDIYFNNYGKVDCIVVG